MVNTKDVGDLAELKVATALVEKGWAVSIPWGENSKYDLLADDGEKIHRVQVKAGRLRNGAILYNTYTSHHHRGGGSEYYGDAVDYFGVYCKDLDSVYLVPSGEAEGTLRVEPTRNNQSEGIRFAEEYKI